jgi:hypothetical protein
MAQQCDSLPPWLACAVAPLRRGKWWKVPLTLLALGLAAAGGYYGYQQYEEHRDKQGKGSSSKPAASKKK